MQLFGLGTAIMAEKPKDETKPEHTLRLSSSVYIPLKYVCLGVLVVQTSTLVLVMRYTRTAAKSGTAYIISTAVVASEVLKMLICFVFLIQETQWKAKEFINLLQQELKLRWKEGLKLIVPAILYTFQNNLLYIALSNLDAATYQVTYQLKILTTALFSVGMLKRRLNVLQWTSLVILMAGVALVQMPSGSKNAQVKSFSGSSQMIGLLAVLVACFSSGFAGVYFEKLLKGSKISLWMRNLQLAFYGILFGLVGVVYSDWKAVSEDGFFQGYTSMVWFVVFLQAFGGLVVSTVIKYADNILKGFATSISIVLSSVISYYFIGDFIPSMFFVVGASLVLLATYLYSLPASF